MGRFVWARLEWKMTSGSAAGVAAVAGAGGVAGVTAAGVEGAGAAGVPPKDAGGGAEACPGLSQAASSIAAETTHATIQLVFTGQGWSASLPGSNSKFSPEA